MLCVSCSLLQHSSLSVTEYRNQTRSERRPFSPCFCFILKKFLFSLFFLPRHGSRRTIRCPSPSRSPLLRVCRGILRARCDDGIGGRHHQHSVLARGQPPSPRGPPRHHRTKLEGRNLLVSGECPGPSQNQPTVSSAYSSSVKSVSCASVKFADRSPELAPVQALAPDRSQVMSPEILSTGTILVGLVSSVGVPEKRTASLVMATEAIPKPPASPVASMEAVPEHTPEKIPVQPKEGCGSHVSPRGGLRFRAQPSEGSSSCG